MNAQKGPFPRETTILLLSLSLVDQLTKLAAIEWLRGAPPRIYLGDLFRLQYAENPGAFLSLGSSMPPAIRFWVFSVAVGAFLLGCVVYLYRSRDQDRLSSIGLAIITSGGISNLIDRLFRPGGRVIDFMNVGIGDLRTGIFNVADMAIMLGVGMMLWSSLRAARHSEREQR
ncbi:MAG: signal peptidase II [Oligoflexia bacterium]|nr:signal peptidase II [Oligoflexia bacterium]